MTYEVQISTILKVKTERLVHGGKLMRKIDDPGCKFCGGPRLVYRTCRRSLWIVRYRRCINCGDCSKTVQSCYQMLPVSQLPTEDETGNIESAHHNSQ